MTERDLLLLASWMLWGSSMIQATIHWVTWWALGPDSDRDRIGYAMRQRELSLGVKAGSRGFFDAMLAGVLTWGIFAEIPTWLRVTVYIAVVCSATAAIWYGWRYLDTLRRQNWGRPGGPTV